MIGSEVDDPAAGATLLPVPPGPGCSPTTSRPEPPTLVDSRGYDGSLVTARQVGSVVRLVLDGGLPALHFETPSSSTITEKQSLAHNRQVVRDSTVSDWLPQVATYNGGQESSARSSTAAGVAVPETFNGLGTLAVVGLRPGRPR